MTSKKQWICDSCNELIEDAESGWIEWYSDKNTNLVQGFRIVHHDECCQYDWCEFAH